MKKVLIAIALTGFTVFGIANIAHADLAQDQQQVTQVIHQMIKEHYKKPSAPARITKIAFSGSYAAVKWEKGENLSATTTLNRTDKGWVVVSASTRGWGGMRMFAEEGHMPESNAIELLDQIFPDWRKFESRSSSP
ncbi:MAG: hypothetical protein HC851_23785 [Acaryochloris sp. RU_4_1]|nr:hypothetical protein [Acaryochloris sp. RU_4_1]NJR57142.1 hypothetical protein [Acaryochloris sp. CRU_2_0]